MTDTDRYIPGVCNIGPAETKRRRAMGWGALITALLLASALFALGIPTPWRLCVFFPATLAASGFLQAASHFCVGFGFMSVFNFGEPGKTDSVTEAEFRLQDRRKAQRILAASLAIGVLAALLAYWV